MRPASSRSLSFSIPKPVTVETARTSAPGALIDADATAASTSSLRSAFVSTTTGIAPLSHASVRYRSSRRSLISPDNAVAMSATSTFPATTCAAVASPAAFEGIEAEPGRDLIVAGEAGAMADEIAALIEAPDRAAALGTAGRTLVVSRYGWEARLAPLEGLILPTGAARAAA